MGTLRQRDPVIDELLDRVGDDLVNEAQRASFARYTLGLLSDLERKSLEPIAAAACPAAVARAHQGLCYFVGAAVWPDAPYPFTRESRFVLTATVPRIETRSS
jgi:SRSO17 transposase